MRVRVALVVLIAALVAALLLASSSNAVPAAATSACHITLKASRPPGKATTIAFVNKTHAAVEVYWVNYQGRLVFYLEVSPGASVSQKTFAGSAWMVLNSNFKCVGFVVTPKAQYVIS